MDFEDLKNSDGLDISTLDISAEKLDVLGSLGVLTANEYEPKETKVKEVKEDNEVPNEDLAKADEPTGIELATDDVVTPNIILPKTEIVKALKYAQVMIKKVTNDIESSSLNITYVDEGKVLYRLKDNMTWVTIEGKCEVANNTPLTKTLSFKTVYLTKLLTAGADKVPIFEGTAFDNVRKEEKEVVYARLLNGDYILDVQEGDENKLVPAGNKSEKLKSIPSSTVSTLCDVITPLVADTQEIQHKRAVVYDDRAFFRSSTYLLQIKGSFSNMCLSKKELDLLKLASSIDTNANIDIFRTDSIGENRLLFVAPGVTISTSVSIPTRDEMIVSRLSLLENNEYMPIDRAGLDRVLFLSCIGTGSVARVSINYSVEEAGLDVETIGRDGNSKLVVKSTNNVSLTPRERAEVIYSPQATLLMKSFDGGSNLQIALTNDGLAFKDTISGIEVEGIVNYQRQ